MLPAVLSSLFPGSDEGNSTSSEARVFAQNDSGRLEKDDSSRDQLQDNKRKRKVPGNPDPDAEVIALSPETLLTTNRFVCEICNKGFQRDQNLQLHRRGHNLPWKLKQRDINDTRKKVYVCPEATCVHHHPARALGDLTGIKKHYCRKHGEKKWKCNKCKKDYAVQSDWKAHSKLCGTKDYKCDCGTLFTRKDSLITHRAFCDALAQERARISTTIPALYSMTPPYSATDAAAAAATPQTPLQPPPLQPFFFSPNNHHFPNFPPLQNPNPNPNPNFTNIKQGTCLLHPPLMTYPEAAQMPSLLLNSTLAPLSATTLLQRAETVGQESSTSNPVMKNTAGTTTDGFTIDFLGLAAGNQGGSSSRGGDNNGGENAGEMLKYAVGVEVPDPCDFGHSMNLKLN